MAADENHPFREIQLFEFDKVLACELKTDSVTCE